jgi:hypothetical protein
MDAQEAKKWLDAKYGNDSSPFIEDDDLINAVAQDLTEFAAAHSAQVEAELYSARSDRDMQIEVRHRAEAELNRMSREMSELREISAAEAFCNEREITRLQKVATDGGARPDPAAWLISIRVTGKGKREEFACIDYSAPEGVEVISRQPLYLGATDGGARELEQEDSPTIKILRELCEANVVSFSNDDVSELLVEIDRLRLATERKAGR